MRKTLVAMSTVIALVLAMATAFGAEASPGGAGASRRDGTSLRGSSALTGADAASFRLPEDVRAVWTAHLANGLTQTRYQQMVGDAAVLGGQLTVLQDPAGSTVAVIGAHFPGLIPRNSVALTAANARAVAERRIGAAGTWLVRLMIDPADAHLFYEVENRRFAERWIQWIDAGSGAVRNAFDAIAEGTGTGVKGDTKTIDTTSAGGSFVMISADGRQETYDARNRRGATAIPGSLFTDADDTWNLAGTSSPGQPAGVDAHYYANVTDDFYLDVFGRDSLDDNGMVMVSTAHFARRYNNAFWNGSQMVYGDGDGALFRELSGGLDVVGHELTHGVTQFTSNLIYQDESGALNEAFSDMMGNTVEFYAAANSLDPSVSPDFLIGEDIMVLADVVAGFRNMGDPQEDDDPDHYSELVITNQDNGGVHTNSGIPNHAYFLLASGGANAGCDAVGSNDHTHTANCDVTVSGSGIGIDDAAQIFFTAFTSLPQNANMCSARLATLAAASAYEGGAHVDSTANAWTAVGVTAACTPPPPPPACGDADASIPFESDHPYANNQDCTWTYDNVSANFRLHFSLFNVETDFDFVFVVEGDGDTVDTLTGNFPGGLTTGCITTSTVDVRLVTDPLVVRPGFTVDAVVSC